MEEIDAYFYIHLFHIVIEERESHVYPRKICLFVKTNGDRSHFTIISSYFAEAGCKNIQLMASIKKKKKKD